MIYTNIGHRVRGFNNIIKRGIRAGLVPVCMVVFCFAATCSFASEARLSVATFNIRYKNQGDDARGNGWAERKSIVSSLVRFYGFDIVGLQEATHEQLQDVLREGGFDWFGVARGDGATTGEYCAILVNKNRFKSEGDGTFWLSETPKQPSRGWDAKHNRICTWVRLVDLQSGRKILVFNTHLDDQGSAARIEGAKLILERLAEMRRPDDTVVLLGDFNATRESPAYVVLSAKLQDALCISETPTYGPPNSVNRFTFDSKDGPRIDHIWVAGGVRVIRHGTLTDSVNGRFPSDHFPVMAELLVGNGS